MEATHRFYTRSHEMKTVAPILTGTYLASKSRDMPPQELREAMGLPVTPALAESEEKEKA